MNESQNPAESRRGFLKATSGAVATSVLADTPWVHAAEDNTIRIALVGCGGRGTGAAANAMATKSGPVKLVAMADIFEDRLQRSHNGLIQAATKPQTRGSADSWVGGFRKDQLDVTTERQFLGFDAYQKAMQCLGPGDVVILTTPVAFRGIHFAHAIERGLNVFMEKPLTVDGPTTRRMFELAEKSKEKNLKVGVGLMCRHCKARWALYDRIQSGEIGDLVTLRTYRQHGPAGFISPRTGEISELLWQIRHYLGFMWASGGLFQDYVAHNVDECCWMKNAWPVRAQGSGGRQYRGEQVDQNFDHYDVEYTFADGSKLNLHARNMVGCHSEFASYAQGTRGSAVISTSMHTPAKCRIYNGWDFAKENLRWAFPQPEPNPYETEWDELIDAILGDKPFNEVKRSTEASLASAMARRAVHTGRIVTFDEMLQCDEEFATGLESLTMDSPAPVGLGRNGIYPTPMPGLLTKREY